MVSNLLSITSRERNPRLSSPLLNSETVEKRCPYYGLIGVNFREYRSTSFTRGNYVARYKSQCIVGITRKHG